MGNKLDPRLRRRGPSALSIILGLVLLVSGSAALADAPSEEDLSLLSLEDLMDIEITSVAKREQRLSEAAAAVFVVTGEDIRRSGAASIPEALRMVPGLSVARIDANKWAISARGFNNRFAGQMLVLVDGRSVYTPLFSGVYWDVQDVLLEDVARIEVIRGPGATLWGANAVNGVINVITKHTAETEGTLISAAAGDEERATVSVRHGGSTENGGYRVYAKYFDRDDFATASGGAASDAWDQARIGFRMDRQLGEANTLTLNGEYYEGTEGQLTIAPLLVPPYATVFEDENEVEGGHLLARWERRSAGGSTSSLQGYVDRTERSEALRGEERLTFDVEYQQRRAAGSRHELIWGLGYRRTTDDIANSFEISFDPDERSDDLFSGFVQDDFEIGGGGTRISVGSKFEYNDYTGFEVQPNVRIIGSVGKDRMWGAVSRAVRSPSRAFHDSRAAFQAFPDPFGPGPTNLVVIFGDRDFESETVVAWEVGYRRQRGDRGYVDVAAFYNQYDDLTSLELGAPFFEMAPIPHVVIPQIFDNLVEGDSFGIEVAWGWRASERCRLFGSYSLLEMDMDASASSTGVTPSDEGASPEHQLQAHASFALPGQVELDVGAYFVDDLPSTTPSPSGAASVDSYTKIDLRLGWKPWPDGELFLVVRDALDDRHEEFGATLVVPSLIERGIHGGVRWRF